MDKQNELKNLKKDDIVVMTNKSKNHEHYGKVWTCGSDSVKGLNTEAVSLIGFPKLFKCNFLQIIHLEK